MPVIDIPQEIETQYAEIAHRTGESKDDLVREALLSFLEDRHDVELAVERLQNPGRRVAWDDVKRDLGLDD
jgi:predicted DNA-binding protein